MGVLSRGTIALVLLGIAPLLAAPDGGIRAEWGWNAFSAWDSEQYLKIATLGYEQLPDGRAGANVAFFPLYPLLIYFGTRMGMSAIAAGTIINNFAFFACAIAFYCWIQSRYGESVARWSTAVLAWCPLSLFGTVVYSEGLFLLFSTLTLSCFDSRRFWRSLLWGILATATRITGLAVIPALLITAILRKYPLKSYLAALGSSLGVTFYGLYCQFRFGDFTAFISVQYSQWERSRGIDWQGWSRMFVEIVAGGKNWKAGQLADLTHPFIVGGIGAIALFLWLFRRRFSKKILDFSYFGLFCLLWIVAGDPLLNTLSIGGGIYLLWYLRKELDILVLSYGFCGLGLLIASGGTISLNRLAYGLIPLSLGLGILFARNRRWGFAMMGFFGILLISMSVRFAQHLWVA